jgi:hypothetical protein
MLARALICFAALTLSGCDMTDPYLREGVWRPNGSTEANLRAMVAAPADLARGVSAPGGDGQQAAAALDRYRNDKVRPLPDSALAKVVAISAGSGSQ